MFRKINLQGPLGIFLLASIAFAISFAISYGWAQQNRAAVQSASSSLTPPGSDRDQDGLSGPVNRVRTETARLSIKSGKLVEGPREVMESSTYDPQGKRIDNSFFLVSSNFQVGTEEYAHDEQGNVSEMTLRDNLNNILSKEVYSYEHDAIGNWVKMISSTVVYEGGKVARQPREVTYRNISYYFDQAIAEIAKPNSSTADSPEQPAQDDFARLRGALDGWIAATNARDLDGLMRFYGSELGVFYRARNVSQEFVRADKSRSFGRVEMMEVRAGLPEIAMSPDKSMASMRFRKEYSVKIDGRERRGDVIQMLRWQRTGDDWKIVGERDIKVFRKE